MILKAYIVQLPDKGSNEFQVRIPYFEGNTNREVIYSALLCNQPGEYDGYKVGDCVWVGFEDTRLNVPIILGKLYVEKEEEIASSHTVNNLNVTGSITLPADTKIGGYSTVDIFKNAQKESETGTLSDLDYEEICDIKDKLSYVTVDTFPYSEEQEAYCKIWYPYTEVDYDIAKSWVDIYMEI